MENRPTILKLLQKVFVIYGITTLILNIFTLIFGDAAKEMSTIFRFGNGALGVKTAMQFLLAVFILVLIETLFTTDIFIKKMKNPMRICLVFVSIFVVISLFIVIFGWIPTNMALPWIMFIICFAISSAVSTIITAYSEKQENKKLDEALKRFKGEENGKSN
ncbi:MAG: hypothetical protein IJB68_00500 [Ruminococcus sp.]|nr:hypothetical protein [Ruminococcus sp.]